MKKNKRQFIIKEIISQKPIINQFEIVEELKKHNISTNQATVSRDLKELGISKTTTMSGLNYRTNANQDQLTKLQSFLVHEIESITTNKMMVVIKTLSGRAHGVAQVIDSLQHPLVMGTLAGDNTIFLAPVNKKSIPTIMNLLKKNLALT